MDVIYTDLEKAFDKIPHKRLISKLSNYGLNKELIEWITAFLINRKQRVRINTVFSDWADVDSGIPQGSLLGPVLFIIYISDLIEYCDCGYDLYLYADDAKVFKHIKNELDSQVLQDDLIKMKQWMDIQLLQLNVTKCNLVMGKT